MSETQIHQILKFLPTNLLSNNSCVSLVQPGIYTQTFSYHKSSPWIIDSGASDHMTSSSFLFNSYSPLYCNEKVRILDGDFSLNARKGTIKLTNNITRKVCPPCS